MGISEQDIIIQYEFAKSRKSIYDAADRELRRLDGERINKPSTLQDKEFLWNLGFSRNLCKGSLIVIRRNALFDHNQHRREAAKLRESRDKQDSKSFLGRRRIARRTKERARYIKQQQRKREKEQARDIKKQQRNQANA